MANNNLPNFQQDTRYGYKAQGKVNEFEWLTNTYVINYFPSNGSNAAKIAEIVWTSLTGVKKIVIYTNPSNYLNIDESIEKRIKKNSLSKIVIINQSHSSQNQLKQKYA